MMNKNYSRPQKNGWISIYLNISYFSKQKQRICLIKLLNILRDCFSPIKETWNEWLKLLPIPIMKGFSIL